MKGWHRFYEALNKAILKPEWDRPGIHSAYDPRTLIDKLTLTMGDADSCCLI